MKIMTMNYCLTHAREYSCAVDCFLELNLDLYRPGRSLRSGNMQLLKKQSFNLKSYGLRAFSICAPWLWNALPSKLRWCNSLGSFQKALKTFLFGKAFYWNNSRQVATEFLDFLSVQFVVSSDFYSTIL